MLIDAERSLVRGALKLSCGCALIRRV